MSENQKPKNIVVCCPNCGGIHVVPNDKKTWKCHCRLQGETGRTRKYSVQETVLEDQTSLTLECGITTTPNQSIQMANCCELEHVTIKGYQIIPVGAFRDCISLRTVNLFKGVEVLDERAFAGCSSLEEIVLPEGLKSIRMGAFQGSGLKRITLPDSIVEIGSMVFADCLSLEAIVLPEELTQVGKSAFQGSGLKCITFPDGVLSIGKRAFADCSSLEEIVLPEGLKSIGEGAFHKSGLKHITLPDGVMSIGERAFAGCSSLEEIVLPEGLKSIGEGAFHKSGLKYLTLPDSVCSVHPNAFAGCCQLEEIKMSRKASIHLPFANFPQSPFLQRYLAQYTREDGVLESHTCLKDGILKGKKTCLICYRAQPNSEDALETFAYVPEITELCFESGIRVINEFMFRGCCHLKRVILPEGLEKIGEGAFADCTSLEEIAIPESVVEIAPFAFGRCTSLRNVEISERLLEKLDFSVFALTPFAGSIDQLKTKRWRNILVVGLGTSAGYIVSNFEYHIDFRHDILVLDTELPDEKKECDKFILLGENICHGNSAKGNKALGEAAIQKNKKEICREFQKHDVVIVVVRLGGGTGSGGAPVLVQWLQKMGIPHLLIASMPQPLLYESKRRILRARQSIIEIKKKGTVPLVLSNKWICRDSAFDGYMRHDFEIGNNMLYCIVRNIVEFINIRALEGLDFNKVNSILKNANFAHIYYGSCYDYNKEKMEDIAWEVSRFLSITSARGIIVCFLMPSDTNPKDISTSANIIHEVIPEKANFIWGIAFEKNWSKPGILFLTIDDEEDELSLKSDSIILKGGYPVLVDNHMKSTDRYYNRHI